MNADSGAFPIDYMPRPDKEHLAKNSPSALHLAEHFEPPPPHLAEKQCTPPPPHLAEKPCTPPPCHLAVRFFDDESREVLRVTDPSRVESYSGKFKIQHIRAGFRWAKRSLLNMVG